MSHGDHVMHDPSGIERWNLSNLEHDSQTSR
jgi:hypothetical protein